MNYFEKRSVIFPNGQSDMAYWTKKWGVDPIQINNAILETGSVNLQVIKNVLIKKGELGKFSLWLYKISKIRF